VCVCVCVCVYRRRWVWEFPLTCLHTPTSVSAHFFRTCPHTHTMCTHICTNVSLIRCVLILRLMCPDTPSNFSSYSTPTNVASYSYKCVFILLPYRCGEGIKEAYGATNVSHIQLILLLMCFHTRTIQCAARGYNEHQTHKLNTSSLRAHTLVA